MKTDLNENYSRILFYCMSVSAQFFGPRTRPVFIEEKGIEAVVYKDLNNKDMLVAKSTVERFCKEHLSLSLADYTLKSLLGKVKFFSTEFIDDQENKVSFRVIWLLDDETHDKLTKLSLKHTVADAIGVAVERMIVAPIVQHKGEIETYIQFVSQKEPLTTGIDMYIWACLDGENTDGVTGITDDINALSSMTYERKESSGILCFQKKVNGKNAIELKSKIPLRETR